MSQTNSAPKFAYVGGSSAGRVKIDWPLEAQAIIVKINKVDGIGGQKAFQAGVALFNDLVAKGEAKGPALPDFENLPASYKNKNAGSVLYGMAQRFLERCNKGNAETITLATKYGLVVPAE